MIKAQMVSFVIIFTVHRFADVIFPETK